MTAQLVPFPRRYDVPGAIREAIGARQSARRRSRLLWAAVAAGLAVLGAVLV